MSAETEIRERLFALTDLKYKDFQAPLIPSVDRKAVLGVRTPLLRKYARELAGSETAARFMSELPHRYYEENNLHGFLIEQIRDFDTAVGELEKFLPYVDNWATCDSMNPKILGKQPDKLLVKIRQWIKSDRVYTVRYGLGQLMRYFLDGSFKPEYLELAAGVKSEEYYINMMIAWFFATALAKQYDAALPYIEDRRLTPWTHNKAIQKARESLRVGDEHKAYLNTLKIK